MEPEFTVGGTVQVTVLPPFVKTAEPMPMLRPPYVIRVGETGVILDRRPGGYWAVRFEKGAFLIESQYIAPLTPGEPVTVKTDEVPEASPLE